MVNKSYAKGYRFEKRVQKHIQAGGWLVFRQGKSAFPDLICIKDGVLVFVECKMNKYLSKNEKAEATKLSKHAPFFVAYRDKKRRIVLAPFRGEKG